MDKDELRKKVWAKGQIVEGFAPSLFRKDACGAWIVWDKFGVQDNLFGWEIDHVCPKSRLQQRGFSDEEIDDLIVLNVKDADWFNEHGYTDQHAGAIGFSDEPNMLDWFFSKTND